ncbi:MAG: twitching motility protein PilT [Verrucomicrobia bacterium]|nr:twitching motility protein PilT [Verrucomicrobiota bacterium]
MLYCDTSTLAKYYVPEPETNAVRSRLDAEDRVMAAELARVELMGVFHRRFREGKWTPEYFRAVARQFQQDEIDRLWTWIPLESSILKLASETYLTLSATLSLRSADCIHLSSARHHGAAELYTHDLHQAEACAAMGLKALSIR